MQNMFSDHNGIRHNRKIPEKIPNYLKLKNPWVKEEIKEKLESILS